MSANELYLDKINKNDLKSEFKRLYPESLKKELDKLKKLGREKELYVALKDNLLTAPGGVIRYKGRVIKRTQLKDVINKVEKEYKDVNRRVVEHDKYCRTVHREAATHIDVEWSNYLTSLTAMLHYVDHTEADLLDAYKRQGQAV